MRVDRFELPLDGLLAARVCLAQRVPAGDPVRIRAVAGRSGAFAAELRRAAAVLLAGVEAGMWAGAAHRALVQDLHAQAPSVAATADRYDHYAAALVDYAGVLAEVGPRLAAARRQLQQCHVELTAHPDRRAEMLPLARGFQADYDRWADALDRCKTALLLANETDPARDLHGLRALEHRAAGVAGRYLSPFEQALPHPTLHNISTSLGELNAGLTVLGLGLLFLCPPAAAACLITASVLAGAQVAVDATRRARGDHVSGASLGLELAAAIPIGGNTVRELRAADNVTHLVPGGGLMAHEGIDRGHTLAKHVGKSEEFLRHRLATEPGLDAASTFHDRRTAEMAIVQVLTARNSKLNQWLATSSGSIKLTAAVPDTGFTLARGAADVAEVSKVIVVLRRSSLFRSGYRIHTAWPAP